MFKLKKKKKLIIWSFDPGQKNFAFSAISKGGLVHRYGLLKHTIDTIKDEKKFLRQKNYFLQEIDELMSPHLEDRNTKCIIVIERFMTRGGFFRNNMSECVLIMIGLLIGFLPEKTKIFLITSAQWKTLFKSRKYTINNKFIKEHIRDAMSMGLYYLFTNDLITSDKLVKIKDRICKYEDKKR